MFRGWTGDEIAFAVTVGTVVGGAFLFLIVSQILLWYQIITF